MSDLTWSSHAEAVSRPSAPVLNITGTQKLLLLGLPLWTRVHFSAIDGRSVGCSGPGCPHCAHAAIGRARSQGYAPCALLGTDADGGPVWFLRTLSVPDSASNQLSEEHIGKIITLRRVGINSSKSLRLVGRSKDEQNYAPKKPMGNVPEPFDVRPYVTFLLTGKWPEGHVEPLPEPIPLSKAPAPSMAKTPDADRAPSESTEAAPGPHFRRFYAN